MSVVGFDVGNGASCAALARKGGIDVLMNKESKRETPSIVSFGEKMRFLGTEGAAKLSMRPKATVTQIKRLLGKKFKDPDVQSDLSRLMFPVKEDPATGGCLVDVDYGGERRSFAPEQLMAMVLVDLKAIVASEQGIPAKDCVVSVPAYYCEAERRAMLDAASVAGLNCLRLMNEPTATALAYGIFKTDLPDNEPTHVAFVDVGHTSLQVCIAQLTKKRLQVLSTAWSKNSGGWDFDQVLFDHFAKEFLEKYRLDVKTNARSSFRLRVGCEKVKKMLSANTEAPMAVECLMEDTDFRSHITREEFEKQSEAVLKQLLAPLQQAVEDSKVKLEQIMSVEVVGNSSRVPAVQRIIESYFKKPVSRTLNAKECISRGCALQCAMLSPVFRVREFEVIDAQPYSVVFNWDKDGQPTRHMMFEKHSSYPSTKLLTFIRSEPFSMSAEYEDDPRLSYSAGKDLATYQVGKFPIPKGAEKAKLKVKVRLGMNGLVDVEAVHAIEEEEYEVQVPVKKESKPSTAGPAPQAQPTEEKQREAAANGQGGTATGGNGVPPDGVATKMDVDTDAPKEAPKDVPKEAAKEAPKEAEEKPKVEKKKRTKKIDVPYTTSRTGGLPKKLLDEYFEQEGKMAATDRLQEETNDRKNSLETYVYTLRNKLCDQLSTYVREQDKSDLMAKLDAMEDWLYTDGEDETKSVYVAKLEELRKVGDPVELRFKEEQDRPAAVQALSDTCSVYAAMARSDAKEYAHIEAGKKEQVVKECDGALAWLNEKMSYQQQLHKHDDPVVLCSDMYRKRDTVERYCKPIMMEPPPPPPKKEEPKPAEQAKDKTQQPDGGDEPQTSQPMDIDEPEKGPPAAGANATGAVPPSPGEPMEE